MRDKAAAVFTLASKPVPLQGHRLRDWVNNTSNRVDLELFNGIGRFNIKYTPMPGWTFNAGYSSYHSTGKRAFGTLFGTSPGSYNITELTEPIDYQTDNVEFGGEYAGNGWTLA